MKLGHALGVSFSKSNRLDYVESHYVDVLVCSEGTAVRFLCFEPPEVDQIKGIAVYFRSGYLDVSQYSASLVLLRYGLQCEGKRVS